MVNIIVVSHSYNLTKEAIEFVSEMKTDNFLILNGSGINKQKTKLGSDPLKIDDLIKQALENNPSGVLIIVDFGSSVLNSKLAIELLDNQDKDLVKIANAPFLEGLFVAVVKNNKRITLDELKAEVEKVREMKKI